MARKGVIAAIVGGFIVVVGTVVTVVIATRKPAAAKPSAGALIPSDWSYLIGKAVTTDGLDSVKLGFDAALQEGQIDQAAYTSLYNLYRDRFSSLAAVPAAVSTTVAPTGAGAIGATAGVGAAPNPITWLNRIKLATTKAQLDAVKSEFDAAYLAHQIDKLMYMAYQNQYADRLAELS